MEQHLIESISEGVATLTLNRPERLNALSTPITSGLLEALPRLARDDSVGVVVLTGAGRAFCAGGDVKSMAEGTVERPLEEAVTHLRGRMEVSRLLHEIPKPTIAMVNGAAAGAGLSLALACDLRIACEPIRIAIAFAHIGFSGASAAVIFCPSLSAPAGRASCISPLNRSMPHQGLALGSSIEWSPMPSSRKRPWLLLRVSFAWSASLRPHETKFQRS
jgi:2-(1,2-epoxy-1,2-dihydrophenyl)acetyl-CoA isomerase